MSRFEIKMPKLGESITEGTIVSWSVKVGESVQEDDVLFEVNTALQGIQFFLRNLSVPCQLNHHWRVPTFFDSNTRFRHFIMGFLFSSFLRGVRFIDVTNVLEVDVTKLVRWREKNKDVFFRHEGVKLTYMPMITEAVAKALVTYPQLNVSVDGYNILFKKHINVSQNSYLRLIYNRRTE